MEYILEKLLLQNAFCHLLLSDQICVDAMRENSPHADHDVNVIKICIL